MLGLDPLTIGSLYVLAASSKTLCKMPKPTEINVTPSTQEVKFDYSKTLAQLQGQHVDTINPYDFTGIAETQGFMSGRIKFQPEVKLNYKHYPLYGAVCIWYESIDVKFEIDPSITIAKEIYEDRCMRKAVKDHEMKHVMADRKVVNKYSKIMGKKIYDGLKQRGFMAGPVKAEYAKQIAERMQDTVFQIVTHEYKKMDLERQDMQQAIDSLEEYERVNSQCPKFQKKRAALLSKKKSR